MNSKFDGPPVGPPAGWVVIHHVACRSGGQVGTRGVPAHQHPGGCRQVTVALAAPLLPPPDESLLLASSGTEEGPRGTPLPHLPTYTQYKPWLEHCRVFPCPPQVALVQLLTVLVMT